MPRSAKFIAQVEWSWSPSSSRLDAYYLSTNRERTHWFVWIKPFDDDRGWLEDQIYAYAPRAGVGSKLAAVHLLRDGWKREARRGDIDRFHGIHATGVLSVAELQAIGRAVWHP